MQTVDVTIRLRQESAFRFDEAVEELLGAGLCDPQISRRFLIVQGSVPRTEIDRIGRLPSVESVRISLEFSAA